jgi:hypothetical protein
MAAFDPQVDAADCRESLELLGELPCLQDDIRH